MSLAERAKQDPPRAAHGLPCSVGVLLATLPPEERAGLQSMLDDKARRHESIYRDITEEGFKVGHQMIGKHRNRNCRCYL